MTARGDRARSIVAIAGARYYEQTGGGIDHKPAAIRGRLLGCSWGSARGDRVEYRFVLERRIDKPVLALRIARGFDRPARLHVRLDGTRVGSVLVAKTGGWGERESTFTRIELALGVRLEPGIHSVSLETATGGAYANLDALAIGPRAALPKTPAEWRRRIPAVRARLDAESGWIHASRYDGGLPLGGIGVGKVELCTDGWFGNLTAQHNWDAPIDTLHGSLFAIRAESVGRAPVSRLLRAERADMPTSEGTAVGAIAYRGMFPRAELRFDDRALPVRVTLTALSSLVPGNVDDSGLPAALFQFTLENPGRTPVTIDLLASWENTVGAGGYREHKKGQLLQTSFSRSPRATVEALRERGLLGVRLGAKGRARGKANDAFGHYVLTVMPADGVSVTTGSWNADGVGLGFWEPFTRAGRVEMLDGRAARRARKVAGLVSQRVEVAAGQKVRLGFVLAWSFPQHLTLADKRDNGHAYLAHHEDARAVAGYVCKNRQRLTDASLEPVRLIERSNLPGWLKLRLVNGAFPAFSNTVLTRDGRFSVIESPLDMSGALGTMDQRLAAHPYWRALHPALDARELLQFLRCQQKDGRITHFDGNFSQTIGNADVGYGVTDWPDLSASWIGQVLGHYRWTGDRVFLERCWPGVRRAVDWLRSADHDGDGIPEGGSTYDYEAAPPGAFSYSAICAMGALAAAAEIARVVGDARRQKDYVARLETMRKAVLAILWDGQCFVKWVRPSGEANRNSFIAALAGDWMVRSIGLPPLFDARIIGTCIDTLMKRHVRAFPLVPPMEVDAKGKSANDYCYILQHEPYLGMEAIRSGRPDDGLEVLRRVFEASWIKNEHPWRQHLNYRVSSGIAALLQTYMTATTTWGALDALAGAAIDVDGRTLTLGPSIPRSLGKLRIPLFYPKFWAWLESDGKRSKIEVIKTFGTPVRIEHVVLTRWGKPDRSTRIAPWLAQQGNTLTIGPGGVTR